MVRSRTRFATLALLGACAVDTSWAEPRVHTESGSLAIESGREPSVSRSWLRLRVDGPISTAQERALEGLLAAQLTRSGVHTTIEHAATPVRLWIDRARNEAGTLLLAVLRVHADEPWQLYIIDAVRGRAILRPIDGDSENAASLEAVASVLASAAAALREGLEVASQPLDVVAPRDEAKPEVEEQRAPVSSTDARTAPLGATSDGAPTSTPVEIEVSGSLGLVATTFADDARITSGMMGSFGVAFGVPVSLRASGAAYLPVGFSSSLGEFDVGRYSGALMVALRGVSGELELQPELGLAVEWLRRSTARAADGVTAREGATHSRLGPQVGARLRVPVSSLLALECSGFVSYFPRKIRFMALTSEARALGAPWPWSAGLQAGLAVH